MRATTINVDGEPLAELERAESPRQSLTAFVRTVIEQEIRRREMLAAADQCTEFLAAKMARGHHD